MAKHKDKRSLGKSADVPFRRRESWQQRHSRRHGHANNQYRARDFGAWCEEHGLAFEQKNDGHHWIINPPGWPKRSTSNRRLIHFAQWWPSSAKLIIGCQWGCGIHCHAVNQLQPELLRLVRRLANREKWIAEVTK